MSVYCFHNPKKGTPHATEGKTALTSPLAANAASHILRLKNLSFHCRDIQLNSSTWGPPIVEAAAHYWGRFGKADNATRWKRSAHARSHTPTWARYGVVIYY